MMEVLPPVSKYSSFKDYVHTMVPLQLVELWELVCERLSTILSLGENFHVGSKNVVWTCDLADPVGSRLRTILRVDARRRVTEAESSFLASQLGKGDHN